jgi:hypothetical protein
MKLTGNTFILFFTISLISIVGCSRQNPETKSDSGISDSFRSQLMEFLSSASKLNAATETGVSEDNLRNLFSEAKGQFDLLDGFWPANFCQEGRADFREAIKGWSYATSDQTAGSPSKRARIEAQTCYEELSQYESNPFGIRFIHYTEDILHEDCIRLDDVDGKEYNSMPALLSIASKYFERGRQSTLNALKQ